MRQPRVHPGARFHQPLGDVADGNGILRFRATAARPRRRAMGDKLAVRYEATVLMAAIGAWL
ncbi:hypothetical protein GCM10010425_68690 [Streptomyces spororaveus]|uniref:Transposase n=1 Tax=Streptomyces spororaveus TaxID=284039 RepID=A0ABQ3T310_9ACTN|nr:hypothetical protein Sspor_03390 [Streptomyces spororaveus]